MGRVRGMALGMDHAKVSLGGIKYPQSPLSLEVSLPPRQYAFWVFFFPGARGARGVEGLGGMGEGAKRGRETESGRLGAGDGPCWMGGYLLVASSIRIKEEASRPGSWQTAPLTSRQTQTKHGQQAIQR